MPIWPLVFQITFMDHSYFIIVKGEFSPDGAATLNVRGFNKNHQDLSSGDCAYQLVLKFRAVFASRRCQDILFWI